ncbi:MAG: hypothetical protein HYT79_07605 [Elusimicrobia bacterium]|nr:hypothetical protein [Elusimicrobiota bacterium]
MCAASTWAANPPQPRVKLTERKGQLLTFDLDFGFYEIRDARASMDERFPAVRLPASVMKNGHSRPEIDFALPVLRDQTMKSVQDTIAGRSTASPVPARPNVRIVALEPVRGRRSLRIAHGELWIDEAVAVRFSLMRSKWSADPEHWWIGYPSQWRASQKRWNDLFIVKDKAFRKHIAQLARETYLQRYGDESE